MPKTKRKHYSLVSKEVEDEVQERFLCPHCTFETTAENAINYHLLKEHSNECKEDDSNGFVRNIRRREPEEVFLFKCPSCDYKTKRKHDLAKHQFVHQTDNLVWYKCSECNYQTKRRSDMPKHMLAHVDAVEMHKCPHCPYQTKRKSDLPKHIICHQDTNKLILYSCPECSYSTKRKNDLPKHILSHRDINSVVSHRCTECVYKTKRKNDLHKHMLVHSDKHTEGIFKCAKCSFTTARVHSFAKHLLNKDCQFMEKVEIIGDVGEDGQVEYLYAEEVENVKDM